MKPTDFDPDIWRTEADENTSLGAFLLTFAVFVLWLVVALVYVTVLTP